MSRPSSVTDAAWEDFVAVAKHNDNLVAMAGYKELAAKPGEFQKHYKDMYEHLKRVTSAGHGVNLDDTYHWSNRPTRWQRIKTWVRSLARQVSD